MLKIVVIAHVKENIERLSIAIAFRGEDILVKCSVHTYSWNYNKKKRVKEEAEFISDIFSQKR